MTRLVIVAVAAALSLGSITTASAHGMKKHHHFKSSNVSMGQRVNNPTPTRHDPAGTRTQCRGGCN
jgi:hypothetical protein